MGNTRDQVYWVTKMGNIRVNETWAKFAPSEPSSVSKVCYKAEIVILILSCNYIIHNENNFWVKHKTNSFILKEFYCVYKFFHSIAEISNFNIKFDNFCYKIYADKLIIVKY